MRARAAGAAATRGKILGAVQTVTDERPVNEVTLAAIAKQAGVTVQTVLRHFGSREGLMMAALVQIGATMGRDRDAAKIHSEEQAIATIVDHYDKFGDRILKLLGAEDRNPALRPLAEAGRVYHREWCEQVFAASLADLRGTKRQRRIAQFVAVTDIYVWKLLRRDRELSAEQTKLAMRELLEPMMETS